jgi:hypothetical protein
LLIKTIATVTIRKTRTFFFIILLLFVFAVLIVLGRKIR